MVLQEAIKMRKLLPYLLAAAATLPLVRSVYAQAADPRDPIVIDDDLRGAAGDYDASDPAKAKPRKVDPIDSNKRLLGDQRNGFRNLKRAVGGELDYANDRSRDLKAHRDKQNDAAEAFERELNTLLNGDGGTNAGKKQEIEPALETPAEDKTDAPAASVDKPRRYLNPAEWTGWELGGAGAALIALGALGGALFGRSRKRYVETPSSRATAAGSSPPDDDRDTAPGYIADIDGMESESGQ